jgi:hypothetical protein
MKRPGAVTTLLWMVLILLVWNIIRMIATLADWTLLREFAPVPGPIYLIITASAWTVSWFAVWRLIHHRHVRARRYTLFAALGYAIWWWLDRLLLQEARPNWPFALITTIVILALTVYCLYDPRTRAYFQPRENHDPETTHPETS